MTNINYSIVIPIFNESEVLKTLYEKTKGVMEKCGEAYEIIFVDDGSKDISLEILIELAEHDSCVVIIQHCKNFGQSASLATGFRKARGNVIISLDGDLQHDPEEIPHFIEKINEGYDLVSGCRVDRVDNYFTRRIPSKIANWIMAKVSGIQLRDFGTTFKAYRREILDEIELIGELHRFIPALVSRKGALVCEIPIKNIPRPVGKSNYNITRTFRVVFDILTIKFIISYMDRPLHLYGGIGIIFFSIGFLIAFLLSFFYYFSDLIIQEHVGNLVLSILMMILGVQFTAFGLMMEMISRIYHNTSKKELYPVKNIYKKNKE